MNFKKFTSIIVLVASTQVFIGCSSEEVIQDYMIVEGVNDTQNNVKNKEEQTYIVKVQNVEGTTILAEVGELVQSGPPALPEGEEIGGDGPPALPDGEIMDKEEPPAKPGEQIESGIEGEEPLALPEGVVMGEEPPAKPNGQAAGAMSFVKIGESLTFTISTDLMVTIEMLQGTQEGNLENIGLNNVLEVVIDDTFNATEVTVKNLTAANGFGGSHTPTHGTSAQTLDTDLVVDGITFVSTGDDENAVRIDGAEVSLENVIVQKLEGNSSNTENGDFYGQNAGLLAMNGAHVTISEADVATSTLNGNGIFSYGEGTVVDVSNTTIHTSENNSGGIQITGGGTMYASNLQVETKGNSSAAIRSDRGGGTVYVERGSYTTNGTGSPVIYSTADITVADAVLTATASEGIVIEGKNSVTLENCEVTGNMTNEHLDASENVHNIMIYQSMSGDSEIGKSYFSATNGKISALQGDMIYVTNTSCQIDLSNVELALANDVLLKVVGNESVRGWGTPGSNGGKCELNATNQKMTGKIIVDEISTLNMFMSEGSVFEGVINEEGTGGAVHLTIDETSQWTLKGDAYITSLDGGLSNIVTNGFTLYINGEAVQN